VGQTTLGDTEDRADNRSSTSCGSAGPEDVFVFEAEQTGEVNVRVSLGPNVVVYARQDCIDDAHDIVCVDNETTGAEHLRFSVVAGETYFIVVDSIDANDVDGFQILLNYAEQEASCVNGIDDNGDLLVDCDDPTCREALPCGGSLDEVCESFPEDLAPGVAVQGTTIGGLEGLTPSLGCGSYASTGRSRAYRYTPRARQALRVELNGTYVQTWHVRSDCADEDSQIACFPIQYHYENVPGFAELPQGPDYTLFVTASEPGLEEPFALETAVVDLEDREPNEAIGQATPTDGSSVGFISGYGDVDVWSFEVPATDDVTVSVTSSFEASDCGTVRVDPTLEILDANGTSLGSNDDMSTGSYCSQVPLADLPAGTYFAVVRPYSGCSYWCAFPYRIGVTL